MQLLIFKFSNRSAKISQAVAVYHNGSIAREEVLAIATVNLLLVE